METLVCENLSFSYPLSDKKVLNGINLKINSGEFVVLCGKSGCGKTTLLKHFKPEIAPYGKKSGKILFDGVELSGLSRRDSASKIGFVSQDAESQTVTDEVSRELAFGLENLGASPEKIRLKLAETASYFGMGSWFHKKTDELSEGSRRLLNAASIMTTDPELIVFDEPVSRLDPASASDFFYMVSKINREAGVTVIVAEHRLEEALSRADRVLFMRGGKIYLDCPPKELSARIAPSDKFALAVCPASARIFAAIGRPADGLVSENDGASRLSSLFGGKKPAFTRIEKPGFQTKENAVEIKNLFFRYRKNDPDVISNLSLKIPKGGVFAIMGGVGSGKSTLLKLAAGSLRPLSGKIRFTGPGTVKVLALPQDARRLFAGKTVREELEEATGDAAKAAALARSAGFSGMEERRSYDLSAGETQKLALAKLTAQNPDILLLDEPTRGMDREFKTEFSKFLMAFVKEGKTVVAASHDVEFCAETADLCAMLFDSDIVCVKPSGEFFVENFFYTTAARRISRRVFENCVVDEDVISLCRKNLNPKDAPS